MLASALRLSLRDEDGWEELRPFIDDEECASLMHAINKPSQILQRQGERLADARRRGAGPTIRECNLQ